MAYVTTAQTDPNYNWISLGSPFGGLARLRKGSDEWRAAWSALVAKLSQEPNCQLSGWEYIGSELRGGEWGHCFRNSTYHGEHYRYTRVSATEAPANN